MAQANVKLTVDATQAQRALKGVQQQSSGLERAFGGLKSAILGVGVTALGRQAILTSANFEKLNVRLGLLTKASGTFARSQEVAAEAQKLFGLSATEALEGITNITARLQPLGVGVEDIRTTFIGFNTAAKLAGASAMESSAAFRQLAQALGSGRLQGDEFRSIAEQVPTILAPIAAELGTTVGGLKKFASEGKLTSSVVIRALKKVELDGAASLKSLLENDPTQVFKDLGNEAENLSRAFGDALAPAILPVIRGFTKFVEIVTNFINSGGGQITLIFTGIAVAIKGVLVVAPLLSAQILALKANFAGLVVGAKIFTGSLVGVKAMLAANTVGFATATAAANTFKIALAKTGIGIAVIALGTLAAKFIDNKNSAKAAADEIKAFDNNLKGIVETADKTELALNQLSIANKQFELDQLGGGRSNRGTQKRLERELKILKDREKMLLAEQARQTDIIDKNKSFNDKTIEFLKNITELENQLSGKKVEQISLEERIQAIKEQHGEEDSKQLIELLKKEDSLIKQVEIMNEQKKVAEELKKKFAEIGQSVEDNLVQNLTDAVMGAQSLGDALTNVLKGLQRQLVEMAIQNAVGGFGGFVGNILGSFSGNKTALNDVQNPSIVKAANGGKINAGQLTLVGEKGMELFVPSKSGTVIPNHALGGSTNVVVNVDASGTSAQGDEQSAIQLGELIGAAVQSEIAKQQMDGGLLS